MTAKGGYKLSLPDRVFHWAARTPQRRAFSHNGLSRTYFDFAEQIALARGVLAKADMSGDGIAVVAITNLADFWVINLALRSVGLTTIAVSSATMLAGLNLGRPRCVVTTAAQVGADKLAAYCANAGIPLITASPEGITPLWPDQGRTDAGGQILLTSATTGRYKMLLFDTPTDIIHIRERLAHPRAVDHNSTYNVFDFPAWTAVGYKVPATLWTAGGDVLITQGRTPAEALQDNRATHAMVVPHMLAALLEKESAPLTPNPALRLSISGAAATPALIAAAKARIAPNIHGSVGATECIAFAYTPLETDDDLHWHRPIAGREVQAVDENDEPAALGTIGRLRVSTAHGPQSYYRDAAATREFFRDGFFYSGDLAVFRADGRFALCGRATAVINIRGSKLSPEPFEQAFREALGAYACLLSLPDQDGVDQPHLVIESQAPLDQAKIRALLQASLGPLGRVSVHYMATLPRNAMGKIVRREITTALLGR